MTGCLSFPKKEVITVTEVVKHDIAIVERPKPLNMADVYIYVVNENNLEEFKQRFVKKNGDLAFVAFSIKDYENLSLNFADIKRYILQQKEIIIYYEKAITDQPTPKDKKEEQK
jgi:hypothetical protein